NVDSVGAGLPANLEGDGGYSIQPRHGTLLFCSIFNSADIANLNRRAIDVCDDQVLHLAWIGIAAKRPQHQFALAGLNVAAWHVRILPLQGIPDPSNRNFVGSQSFGVDPDVDLSVQATHNSHLADTARPFELDLYDLVSIFSQFANRPWTRQRNRNYRGRVVIEL